LIKEKIYLRYSKIFFEIKFTLINGFILYLMNFIFPTFAIVEFVNWKFLFDFLSEKQKNSHFNEEILKWNKILFSQNKKLQKLFGRIKNVGISFLLSIRIYFSNIKFYFSQKIHFIFFVIFHQILSHIIKEEFKILKTTWGFKLIKIRNSKQILIFIYAFCDWCRYIQGFF